MKHDQHSSWVNLVPKFPFFFFFNKANTKHDSQKSAKTISLPIYIDISDSSLYGIDKMSSLTKENVINEAINY